MTPDLDRIRTTHAVAIANRERGSFDSRDDDIGALLGEVDRLTDDLRVCWVCKRSGATIQTAPQPPDNRAWWFHSGCYFKMQTIID